MDDIRIKRWKWWSEGNCIKSGTSVRLQTRLVPHVFIIIMIIIIIIIIIILHTHTHHHTHTYTHSNHHANTHLLTLYISIIISHLSQASLIPTNSFLRLSSVCFKKIGESVLVLFNYLESCYVWLVIPEVQVWW